MPETYITADAYAELMRAHTRAIHSLAAYERHYPDYMPFPAYPSKDRREMGERAGKVLAAGRAAEKESARAS